MTNEQRIWHYLKAHTSWTDEGIAGLMGNLRAESALNPQNMENAYEKKLGFTDATYTAAVDDGSYTNFARDACGYGLAQWTYWTRKTALKAYAVSCGKSIGDLEMQCAFLIKEIQSGYTAVDKVLRTATDIKAASDIVLKQYENPAVQTAAVQNVRHGYGVTIYNNNHIEQVNSDPASEKSAIIAQIRTLLDKLENL